MIFQFLFSFQCWTSVVVLWTWDCAGLPWGPKLYFKNIWKRLMKLENLLSWEFSKWLGCQLNCDDPRWEPLTPSFRAEHILAVLSEMYRVKLKPQLAMIAVLKMWASLSFWSFLSWESGLKIFPVKNVLFKSYTSVKCFGLSTIKSYEKCFNQLFWRHYDVVFNYTHSFSVPRSPK